MAHMVIEMALAPGMGIPSHSAPADGGPLQLAGGLTFHARPGDVLQGNLVLHAAPDKDLKLNSKGLELYFRGLEETTIVTYHNNKHGSSRHVARGGGELFRLVAPTAQQSAEATYPRGQAVRFPFHFQVPPAAHTLVVAVQQEGVAIDEDNYTCQGGRQRAHQATARIQYEIKAKANLSGIFSSNLFAQCEIIVDPQYPEAPQAQSLTRAESSSRITIPDYCCCDWFGAKAVSASASVAKTALTNGEQMQVALQVHNESDESVVGLSVSLQNAVAIRTSNGPLREARRYVTVHRVETALALGRGQHQLSPSILVANLTPDVHTPFFSSNTCLLVKLIMESFRKPINIRIPLACPYYAPSMLAPMPQPLAAGIPLPVSPHPQAHPHQAALVAYPSGASANGAHGGYGSGGYGSGAQTQEASYAPPPAPQEMRVDLTPTQHPRSIGYHAEAQPPPAYHAQLALASAPPLHQPPQQELNRPLLAGETNEGAPAAYGVTTA